MSVHYEDERLTLRLGDALAEVEQLEAGSVQTVVTSPPYFGLRDYGQPGQYGTEATVAEYVEHLVDLFNQVRRALADDGTVWLNLGDSYAGRVGGAQGLNGQFAGRSVSGARETRWNRDDAPAKNLLGIPWRVAFALQADGWVLRSDIIWAKPNPMPESVTDRPTRSHEYLFLLAKRPRYYFDAEAIREPDLGTDHRRAVLEGQASLEPSGGVMSPHRGLRKAAGRAGEGRNKRSVWTVATVPFEGAHFATFPPALVRPCVLASTRPGDVVLDPFSGSGTTGMVALEESRRYVGIDLSEQYLDLSLRARFEERPLDLYAGEVPRG